MPEWLTLAGALRVVRAGWQQIRHSREKRVAAEEKKIEWQTPTRKWRDFGASARTEKDGEPLRSFRQRSQDYSLLLSEEDYAASGFGDRTGLVAVRWREHGHWVQATARPPARDRKRGDGLREVVLRRHC